MKKLRIWEVSGLLYCLLLFFPLKGFADNPTSFQDFLKQSKLSGNLRSYYFTRDFGKPGVASQSAFSLGGMLNLKTATISGFSADAAYYAADPLDLNTEVLPHLDVTLPGKSVNVLGQLYLQYQNPMWLLRGGDQLIKTPWLNDADSRMIPATYQAIYTTLTPLKNLEFTAFRVFRFKSRTSNQFNHTNLYSPDNFGTPVKPVGNLTVNGAIAGGVNYKYQNLKTQAWYYRFYDFANLAYTDANYTFKNNTGLSPIAGIQLAKEWSDGRHFLESFGLGRTDAEVYGLLLGLEIPNGQISIGYDNIPKSNGAFHNGDFVSPYTSGYTSDPLYTTSMIAGLIEKSAGHAYKLSGNYYLFDKQLKLGASYAEYDTAPVVSDTNEVDFDATYAFLNNKLKGLSIRDRIGILNGNPATGRFVYNRIMLQYEFA